MPNVGHTWTPEEDAATRNLSFEQFQYQYPGISRAAYNLRRSRVQTKLHDELVARTKAISRCKVCRFLAGASALDAAEWRNELALDVNTISHVAVTEALRRRDVDISERSVRRHRGGHSGQ